MSEQLPKTAQDALERLKQGGYIKGYTNTHKRVMDKDHNPLFNLTWLAFDALADQGYLEKRGLVYVLNSNADKTKK